MGPRVPPIALSPVLLVQPHPTPRIYGRLLHRSVGDLQPELRRVAVRVAEPGVGLALEGGELRGHSVKSRAMSWAASLASLSLGAPLAML
jgi:hypothetical protein